GAAIADSIAATTEGTAGMASVGSGSAASDSASATTAIPTTTTTATGIPRTDTTTATATGAAACSVGACTGNQFAAIVAIVSDRLLPIPGMPSSAREPPLASSPCTS